MLLPDKPEQFYDLPLSDTIRTVFKFHRHLSG